MANKIGETVEAEVNVQRLLKARVKEKRQKRADRKEESIVDGHANMNDSSQKDWMYAPSHLQRFTEELNSSHRSRKARLRIARANRRALQLLESSEEWTSAQKIQLGVALLQMLLDTARVDLNGAHCAARNNDSNNDVKDREPAFTHEKQWVYDHKQVGFISKSPCKLKNSRCPTEIFFSGSLLNPYTL